MSKENVIYIYIYMCVCVCVYLYVCIHTHTHTHPMEYFNLKKEGNPAIYDNDSMDEHGERYDK